MEYIKNYILQLLSYKLKKEITIISKSILVMYSMQQ